MRLKRIPSIVPVVVLVVLSLIVAAGCSSDGGGGGTTASAVGTMKQLPKGGDGFAFADLEGMQTNEQLKDLYDSYGDRLNEGYDTEEELGASLDEVTGVATNGEVVLIKGTFQLDDIRANLEDQDYDKGEYKDVETWESTDEGGETAVAFIDKSLIIIGQTMGDLEDCIDAIKGGGTSLYEDENLKDMMDRLPHGIVVGCAEVPSDFANYGYSYLENVDTAGFSIAVKDAKNLLLTVVLKFDDNSDADDAKDEIKNDIEDAIDAYLGDYLEASDVEINVAQDNEYLTVTAEMSIETLASGVEELESGNVGKSNVEAANAELVTVQAAIESCLAEGSSASFDGTANYLWTGTQATSPVITVAGDSSSPYYVSQQLRTTTLKATYTITPAGDVISGNPAGGSAASPWGATKIAWSGGKWIKYVAPAP
jgi:hypothetical protein